MLKQLTSLLAGILLISGLLCYSQSYAQLSSSKTKSSPIPISEALKKITQVYGTHFFYDAELLKVKFTDFNVESNKSKPVQQVLKEVLYKNNLVFLYVKENYYTIVSKDNVGEALKAQHEEDAISSSGTANPTISQARPPSGLQVSGKITGTLGGNPLAGVSIGIKGSSTTTVSGADGTYIINVPTAQSVLLFSCVGYSTKTVAINGKGKLDVSMVQQDNDLSDVVVLGYGTMRKVDVTGTVSSIKGKELEKVPVGSAAEALTGRLAGVQVTTQDGAPGADIDIKIRGGMSITQDNSPLYIIDGFASDVGLKGLAASDIVSIDVLKDASTTSIYGARGANGVILITTRGGKKGKGIIAYDGFAGYRQLPREVGVLSSLEYVKLQYEMALRTGGTVFTSFTNNYGNFSDFQTNYGNSGLDWQNIMFGRKAVNHSHTLSISGGGDNNTYMINYNLNYENGILVKTNNLRNNLRFQFDQKVSKRLDMQLNTIFYSNSKNGDLTAGSTLQNTLLYRPVSSISSTDEELQDAQSDPISNSLKNPKVTQQSQLRYTIDRNIAASLSLNYHITSNLTLKVMGSATLKYSRFDSFDDTSSSAAATRGGAFGSQKYSESFKWQNTNTLQYQKNWNKSNLTAMIGNEQVFTKSQSLTASNWQFPDDNFGIYDLSLGSLPQKPTSEYNNDGLVSFFTRAFYGYNNKYLVTATLRSDGSSKFAENHRFGYFPSVSAAWRIDQERFLFNSKQISQLKLRVSYGQAGNNRIGSNSYESIFTPGWYTNGAQEVATLSPSALANPDLKWETTIASNIGVDFGFFRNRITGSLELYKNKTKDLLLTASIPATTGFSTETLNIGSTQNKGIELTINSINISSKNFTWTTDFNITFNKNKVLSLTTGSSGDYMLFKSGVGSYTQDYKVGVGQPAGQIYGYVYDGFYQVSDFDATYNSSSGLYTYALKSTVPSLSSLTRANFQPGSTRYKDVNGDGLITPDDRTVIGNANPKHFGGINNTFTYKNFDLGIFINWVFGNKILNYTKGRLLATYQANQNQSDDLKNRFTYIDNNGNLITEPTALAALNVNAQKHAAATAGPESNLTLTTSEFVESGSFLRLNNITLGYSFKGSILRNAGISRCHVYATSYNLFTVTNYKGFDPEVNRYSNGGLTPGIDWAAYPKTRSFVFGLNLSF